jgi:hypothetical protein
MLQPSCRAARHKASDSFAITGNTTPRDPNDDDDEDEEDKDQKDEPAGIQLSQSGGKEASTVQVQPVTGAHKFAAASIKSTGGGPFVARGGGEKMLISYNSAYSTSFQPWSPTSRNSPLPVWHVGDVAYALLATADFGELDRAATRLARSLY